MTHEQLLEDVAKALFRIRAFATCDFEDANEDIQESYRVYARAALHVAIKAAAKVADVHFAAGSERHAIAAAIRALLPARKEGGD